MMQKDPGVRYIGYQRVARPIKARSARELRSVVHAKLLRLARLRRQSTRLRKRIERAIHSISLVEVKWNHPLPANFDVRKFGQLLHYRQDYIELIIHEWEDRGTRPKTFGHLRKLILFEMLIIRTLLSHERRTRPHRVRVLKSLFSE